MLHLVLTHACVSCSWYFCRHLDHMLLGMAIFLMHFCVASAIKTKPNGYKILQTECAMQIMWTKKPKSYL